MMLKVITVKNAWFVTICFFNHGFKLQNFVCYRCHALMMLRFNLSDIGIITVKNVNYRCIIYDISKSETIRLLENSVLDDRGIYKNCSISILRTESGTIMTIL